MDPNDHDDDELDARETACRPKVQCPVSPK
jgi:hypothetical protein